MTTELFDPQMLAALHSDTPPEEGMEKEAFTPPPAMGGGGGGAPMDPAAMGGAPPGAAPPGGAPPGMPPAPMPGPPTVMDPSGMGGGMGAMPPGGGAGMPGGAKKMDPNTIYAILYEIKTILISICQHMGIQIPTKAMMGTPPDPMSLAGSQQQYQQQDAQAESVMSSLGMSGAGGGAAPPPADPAMMDPAMAGGAPKMAGVEEVVTPIGTAFVGEGSTSLSEIMNDIMAGLLPKAAAVPTPPPPAPAPAPAYNTQAELAAMLRRFTSGN